MKVTIYDVANEAGVSIASVSRYLNNRGSVSKKNIEKIIDAIEKLHFVPEASAKSLAIGLTGTIGVQVWNADISSDYMYRFMLGAYAAVSETGGDLLITRIEGDKPEVVDAVISRRKMDGIIFPLMPGDMVPLLKALYDKEFPAVYTGARYEWDERSCNVYGGFSSYRKEVMEILIDRGCKRILCIDTDEDGRRKAEKGVIKNGFEKYVFDLIHFEGYSETSVYQYLYTLLKAKDRPDAIFFAKHEIAGIVYAAVKDAGLSIPEDLRLVSTVHSKEQDKKFIPNLAVVLIDAYQMGYQAGKKISDLIRKKPTDEKWSKITYEIRENETLG